MNGRLLNGRLPAANEGEVSALHERTAVGSAAAGALRDNPLRCAACRCEELSWRRVTNTAGHGRVDSEVQRRCSAAGKHGPHREHGSHARTAAPHHRSNSDARSQHGNSTAALHRRTAASVRWCFRTVKR